MWTDTLILFCLKSCNCSAYFSDGLLIDDSKGAASRSLWPEYEITHKDEDEFEEKISRDDSSNISLISRSQADESYGQWMKYFEVSYVIMQSF